MQPVTPDEVREFLSHSTRTGKLATVRAKAYGLRNGVEGEWLIRLKPTKTVAQKDLAT